MLKKSLVFTKAVTVLYTNQYGENEEAVAQREGSDGN